MAKKKTKKRGLPSDFGSSNVAKMSYDRTQQEMTVQFCHGGVYLYSDVEPSVQRAFLRAKSKGRFVNGVLVDRYETDRIE